MKLSEVPFDQLKVGMRVKSGPLGVLGRVSALVRVCETQELPLKDGSGFPTAVEGVLTHVHSARENDVLIDWDNGNQSLVFHHQCTSVLVEG